jgi:hypothetical protein
MFDSLRDLLGLKPAPKPPVEPENYGLGHDDDDVEPAEKPVYATGKWSAQELSILKIEYALGGQDRAERSLSRSPKVIAKKAKDLGLTWYAIDPAVIDTIANTARLALSHSIVERVLAAALIEDIFVIGADAEVAAVE